jgi:hypothetical protein
MIAADALSTKLSMPNASRATLPAARAAATATTPSKMFLETVTVSRRRARWRCCARPNIASELMFIRLRRGSGRCGSGPG